MGRLGARQILLTNAAGGVNADWPAGTLMLLSDHLNLTGRSPLMGPNDDALGPRFPDLVDAWSPRLRGADAHTRPPTRASTSTRASTPA